MDADRFDRFARALSDGRSRRGILGLASAGLAGLAALTGLGSGFGAGTGLDAEARNKKKKHKKKKRKRRKKKCNANPDTEWCGGKCRDILTDRAHCGECSNPCGFNEVCEEGACVEGPVCIPECDGADCGDSDGCGGLCDGPCPGDQICENGVCEACVPECTIASCGDSDGCGGICATCPPGADDVQCNIGTGDCTCVLGGECCLDSDCDEGQVCNTVEIDELLANLCQPA